ncbi:aminoglycoside phosphotransferase family protein [Zwartia sp.]|uniref:aminoglycoside phosphotransferase family protein n=1 Tax=Zwartia sp. TaxID=2978004 RepID=UPI003BB1C779
MLSKLRHFAYDRREQRLDTHLDESQLSLLLQEHNIFASSIRRINGGTLGLSYSLQIDGRPKVLKTHFSAVGRQNIEKEIRLLRVLYVGESEMSRLELTSDQLVRVALLMDEFKYPQHELEPSQIISLTAQYTAQFKCNATPDVIATKDTMSTLFAEGVASLARLYANQAISPAIHAAVEKNFSILSEHIDGLPVALCHGDLGPENIMCQTDSKPVVIDWEDAFWGVEGYDYLYWLTFLRNRKYYAQDVLGKTSLGKEIELAILVLIVVLKSELSLRMDPQMNRQLSFDQRITEILELK